ncbi:acyltransferase 3 [Actinobacteria bacterium OV450]|nr:acyltransferase 3 [Actinobacteria bacterium OV450]
MSTVVPSLPPLREGTPDVPAQAANSAPRRPRLYVLDALRLIAALMVVGFHWTGVNQYPEVWKQQPQKLMPTVHAFGAYGWLGVQLFFLISGFVICMSCWGKTPRQYFTSRVVRLFPAYWGAVVITALVVNFATTVRHGRHHVTPSGLLTNLTMLQQPLGVEEVDAVYWTLWVELRFYLLFAVVVAMGLTYRRVLSFCGIWMIAAVLVDKADVPFLKMLLMPEYAPFFIAGVAMYLIYRFGRDWLLLGTVGFSWLVAQHMLLGTKESYEYGVQHPLHWYVIAGFSLFAFALMLAVSTGVFNWVQGKWLTVAGALTYPVYLLHQEVGFAMIRWGRDHGIAPFALLAMCLAVILLLAWLVHRFVERPLSGVLKRLLDGARLTLPKADPPVRRG